MIDKWLHITYHRGNSWVLPIIAALNDALRSGKVPQPPEEFNELPLYITTRLNMLPRIIKRINTEASELYSAARNHRPEHVFTDYQVAYAFNIDEDLKYNLLIDIDALLFEVNSCTELIMKLLSLVYRHLGTEIPKERLGKTVHKLLAGKGQDTSWFRILDEHRNFFAHIGAPYLAIDISGDAWDLIIMKESLAQFKDTRKFLMFGELQKIVRGFQSGNYIIQEHLVSVYKKQTDI